MNTQWTCDNCFRPFTHKTTLTKHRLLCDILHQSIATIEEECDPQPTYAQMVIIIKQLVHQYHLLEKRITSLERKEKKPNTTTIPNSTPYCSFLEWIQIKPTLDHKRLLEELIRLDVVTAFLLYLQNKPIPAPIETLPENRWFLYDETFVWRKMKKEDWLPLLTHIHSDILKNVILPWKTENEEKIKKDDGLGDTANKMILKFMSIDVTHDSFVHKIKVRFPLRKTDLNVEHRQNETNG